MRGEAGEKLTAKTPRRKEEKDKFLGVLASWRLQ
jgi:hypothetical protein